MQAIEKNQSYDDIKRMDRDGVWHHLTQHSVFEHKYPTIMARAAGMNIWDIDGNQYLDAVSGGLWTVNVGYGRERIANAVRDQLVEMCYFAGVSGTIPGALFADKLLSKMPGLSRVYLSSSGSEANEKAFKIVRQIAHLRHNGQKHKIIYRERDYHGTTISTLSASGQEERRGQYGPFTPGFVEMPHCSRYRSQYGDVHDYGERAARELEAVIQREGPDSVGAVILEPITAGGGVITPPEGYWKIIQEICRKYQLLLILDEVVCGVGRTGKWFGYQHYDVQPDIVTMAKGVASGYAPISCTVTTEDVFQQFVADPADRMAYFRDVSTFGGCASGPAAALENLRIIEDESLLDNVVEMGAYLMDRLLELKQRHAMVGDVRGKGLFAGLELVSDRHTKEPVAEAVVAGIAADCMAHGVIIGRTNRSFQKFNNTLALSPAFIANQRDIDAIVDALDAALGRATGPV